MKARGEGLSLNLRGFEVFDSVDLQPRLRVPGNPAESARWNLFDLDLPGRFVGALVVEGPGHRISCGHWPGDTADFWFRDGFGEFQETIIPIANQSDMGVGCSEFSGISAG